MDSISRNKEIVRRFNMEVIQNTNEMAFRELIHEEFINHSAPPSNNKKEGMWNTFSKILKPAFPDLKIIIHEQIAEGDLVTTRKSILGTHKGQLMDIPPTNKAIEIHVIDIIRIKDEKYYEHWGINDFEKIITDLKAILKT